MASVSLRLPSFALLCVATRVAPTARAQVKGSKGEPLLLYTDSCSFNDANILLLCSSFTDANILLLYTSSFTIVGIHGDPHVDRVPIVRGHGDYSPPPPRRWAGLTGISSSGGRGGDGGVPPVIPVLVAIVNHGWI